MRITSDATRMATFASLRLAPLTKLTTSALWPTSMEKPSRMWPSSRGRTRGILNRLWLRNLTLTRERHSSSGSLRWRACQRLSTDGLRLTEPLRPLSRTRRTLLDRSECSGRKMVGYSFILAISIVPLQVHYYAAALPTRNGYCAGVSRRSSQATVSRGLAQGPYVAARAGVEPTTLWLRVIDLTNAPPRPTTRQLHVSWLETLHMMTSLCHYKWWRCESRWRIYTVYPIQWPLTYVHTSITFTLQYVTFC